MGPTRDRAPRSGTPSPEQAPEMVWNEENAARLRADAAHISYTREEVALRFGDGRRSDTEDELVFEPRAEILLPPALAKRLALRMQQHMRDHERRYGPLDLERRSRDAAVSSVPLDDLPEDVRTLVREVQALGAPCGLERSFKLLSGALLTRRLLLGIRVEHLPMDGRPRLLDLCSRFGMPPDHLGSFQDHLNEATIVLFGFEEEGDTATFRSYLEFGGRMRDAAEARSTEPFTIHLGFKWDPRDVSRKAVTRYTCHPGLTVDRMLERVRAVYGSRGHEDALAVVEDVVEQALRAGPPEAFRYFEAEEERTPRTSFDLNLYAANLSMRELSPLLFDIGALYDIHPSELHRHAALVQDLVFGHLTGGVDRNDRDFMTVYFGEKGSTLRPRSP